MNSLHPISIPNSNQDGVIVMAGRTVKKDGDSWYYLLTHGTKANGKPQQYKKRGFKTKQEAQKAMNDLEHSLTSGNYIKPTKLSYRSYMTEQYLEDKLTKVKQQTLDTYTWLIEKHVLPTLGSIELSKLTPMHIQQLYNHLTKEKKISDENIQKVHTLINDSLKKAERWSLIAKNPASLVDRPKAVKKEVTVWNLEQVQSFLKHADGASRHSIAYFLALTTGMRKGEILGLRWKDVDFERQCVRITQTVSNNSKEILPYTKTKSGARTIDLPEETINQLKKHYLFICHEKEEGGESYCDNDLVVCNKLGLPADNHSLRRIFHNISKKAGNPRIRFHDMRHTHATLLLLQGVNPKIVSERLGHADVRITLDTYSHLLPSMQKETAHNFGKMLFNGSESNNEEPKDKTEKPQNKQKNGPRIIIKGRSIYRIN